MLLTNNIRLSRILVSTWKVDIIMIISCTIAFLAHHFLISKHVDVPSILPTVLGTAIAFFIGFNNNQAYDRWWEARRVWGSLVNDSRSWARAILCYINTNEMLQPDELSTLQQTLLYRHIAFVYVLKNSLRGEEDIIYKKYLNNEEQEAISSHTNKPNAILQLQAKQLSAMYNDGLIDGYRFLQMDGLLVKFTEEMGMSERIKNTIFPTTYSYLTKVFIWLFVVAFELVTADSMGVWSIFISWLVGFVFVSTQMNGMSLVNPFDGTAVSIPLNQITRTIEINVLQMLKEPMIPAPVEPIDKEYIL